MAMKTVLWVCNTPLPEVQGMFGIRNYNEGWLTGISNQLRKEKNIVLHYAFRQTKYKRTQCRTINGITFWGFYDGRKKPNTILKEKIQVFDSIIRKIKPDIIHIFGTEFPHSLECAYSVREKNKIVVSLQGLTSELARVYVKGIPFQDRLAGGVIENRYHCLLQEQSDFYQRGLNEKKLLLNVKNVIGRTDWDRQCVEKINPECKYYYCSETLRDTFYEGVWDIGKIQRHSIFISQARYPIKGFHILLSALPFIKKKYPGVKVCVAGSRDFVEQNTPYGRFIYKLMKKHHVEENIEFLGFLTDEKMKQRLLQAHVMVMPSLLENSPNSVGEAMLLGTPVVAANVGGIPSILKNGAEGYLYEDRNYLDLARRVCKVFSNDNIAVRFSENARKRAEALYDKKINLRTLLEIYDELCR